MAGRPALDSPRPTKTLDPNQSPPCGWVYSQRACPHPGSHPNNHEQKRFPFPRRTPCLGPRRQCAGPTTTGDGFGRNLSYRPSRNSGCRPGCHTGKCRAGERLPAREEHGVQQMGLRRLGTGYGVNPGYSSFVGTEIDVVAGYTVTRFAQVEVGYGHFFAGDYIQSSLSNPNFGSQDANFVYAQVNLSF